MKKSILRSCSGRVLGGSNQAVQHDETGELSLVQEALWHSDVVHKALHYNAIGILSTLHSLVENSHLY